LLRAGVIGVGRLGAAHVASYAKIPEVEMVGVFDSNKELREKVAGLHGCAAYASLEALVGEVDLATVAVPTVSHFEVAEQCLKKGVHLLIEKPLAKTLSEAEKLVELSRKMGLKLQVGHIERFNPAFVAAREHMDKPMFIESHRLAQFNPRGTDVDVVLDLMIHDLDLASLSVAEPLLDLQASGVEVITESDDIANVRLNFQGGCVANLTASRISARNMRKMRLFQRDAYISIDFLNRKSELYKLVSVEEGDPKVAHDTIVGRIPVAGSGKTILYSQLKIDDRDMLLLEVSSFVRAVREDTETEATGEEGLAALKLALATIEVIESQKRKVAV
jgi:predicted dehydrogenase